VEASEKPTLGGGEGIGGKARQNSGRKRESREWKRWPTGAINSCDGEKGEYPSKRKKCWNGLLTMEKGENIRDIREETASSRFKDHTRERGVRRT